MSRSVYVNDESRPWVADLNVRTLLRQQGYDEAWVGVALNGVIVPPSAWESTVIQPDAELDILRPCQGG